MIDWVGLMAKHDLDTVTVYEFDKALNKGPEVLVRQWLGWLPQKIKRMIGLLAFDLAMAQFVNEHGLSAEYSQYLRHLQAYARYMVKVFRGQRHYLVNAEMEIEKANKIMANGGGEKASIFQAVLSVSAALQLKLDPKKISVSEFYAAVELVKRHGQAIEAAMKQK